MKNLAAAGLLVSLALSATAGCSAVLGNVPTHVRAALDPFIREGYACRGGASDHSALRQWQCDETTLDLVHYTVILAIEESFRTRGLWTGLIALPVCLVLSEGILRAVERPCARLRKQLAHA